MKNQIWYFRRARKLTLQRLSQKTGLSRSQLSRIENGETNDILLSHAIAIAKALRADLYDLFCIPITYHK
jgi:transcriptional regulator with XRE-family HTH domain